MVIVYHQDYMQHRQLFGHPEDPSRLESIIKRLKKEGFFRNIIKPEPGKEQDIALVHTQAYIDYIRDSVEGPMDPDTYLRSDTYRIASLAAQGTITAAFESYEKNVPTFALVRPPGHHASAFKGGGFCYFNNVAIACEKLRKEKNIKKVAILDVDLHHGNGTNDIFYESKDVLYISTHQYGIYPGTGAIDDCGKGEGEGYTINIPLPPKCGDRTYNYAFEKIIEPVINLFKPEFLFLSFGVDAHYMDPLGQLALTSKGYKDIIERVVKLSKKVCNNRLVFSLEGGYNGEALGEAVATAIAVSLGKEIELHYLNNKENEENGIKAVNEVVDFQKKYWSI